jgi:1-acyl-sn-glycerol-3-phosphate acyltransferase
VKTLDPLPRRAPWLETLFAVYSRRYLRRHFNAVRLSRTGGRPTPPDEPLIVTLNHASWWDPLVGLFLARTLFPGRPVYGPIDAAALARYRFFARLGFFGVEPGSRRGARQFLRASEAALSLPTAMLWLTPQGRFADVRERPLRFQSGLGHLVTRITRATVVPLVFEYVFWEERLPEILVRFGEPVPVRAGNDPARDPAAWTALLEARMAETMDALATETVRRQPTEFEILLEGRRGVGGIYDLWRRLRARWRGEAFDPKHGRL